MARRRPVVPFAAHDGGLLIPRKLVEHISVNSEQTHRSAAAQHAMRSQWLRDHGIDPGDWSTVYPLLLASRHAYDIKTDALSRARARAERQAARPETEPTDTRR